MSAWSTIFYLFVVVFVFIELRSAFPVDPVESIVNDRFDENHRKLAHAFTGYRHRFEKSTNFKKLRWHLNVTRAAGLCELCDIGVPFVRLILDLNDTNVIDEAITAFCDVYVLLDRNVCLGAAHEYLNAVLQVVQLAPLTNKQLCSLAFECEPQTDFPIFSWNVTFPNTPKPKPSPPRPPTPGSPTLKILHISDVHVDFSYKPGSEADCAQPLCCRGGQPVPGKTGAGFW